MIFFFQIINNIIDLSCTEQVRGATCPNEKIIISYVTTTRDDARGDAGREFNFQPVSKVLEEAA